MLSAPPGVLPPARCQLLALQTPPPTQPHWHHLMFPVPFSVDSSELAPSLCPSLLLVGICLSLFAFSHFPCLSINQQGVSQCQLCALGQVVGVGLLQ